MEAKKKTLYRRGFIVLIALAVLTAIEYYVALLPNSATPALFVIAIIKAWAILQYFMHAYMLWSEEEH